MKAKSRLIALVIVVPSFLALTTGCEMFAGSVHNATEHEVQAVLYCKNDTHGKFSLSPDLTMVGRSNGPDWPFHAVEAFDSSGKKIGEFDQKDVPNRRGYYGKVSDFWIFDDCVLPVPIKGVGKDFKPDEKNLKEFLERERAYEANAGK